MFDNPLTVLNLYRLKGSADAFRGAIGRLAGRVEAEGHPGVRSYRFFVSEAAGVARAVIDYENSAAWIGHHEIAMEWPEMQALHAVAGLSEVIFLGPVAPEISAWIAGSKLTAQVTGGFDFAAGFRR